MMRIYDPHRRHPWHGPSAGQAPSGLGHAAKVIAAENGIAATRGGDDATVGER